MKVNIYKLDFGLWKWSALNMGYMDKATFELQGRSHFLKLGGVGNNIRPEYENIEYFVGDTWRCQITGPGPIHLPPKFYYYYYYYFGGRATSNVSNGSLLLKYGERGGFMACCILRGGMVGIVVDWVKLVVWLVIMVIGDNYIQFLMSVYNKLRPFHDFWESVYVCYVGISVTCPLSGECGS